MNPKELRKLVKLAQKFRLKRLRIGDTELEFEAHQDAPARKSKRQVNAATATTQKQESEAAMPSDDEMLFWSADPLAERITAESR